MLKQIWRGRGRLPKSLHLSKEQRVWEYLSRIAVKHGVDSSEFYNCIVEAWNQKESECKHLVIICRKRMKNSAIFLFTNDQKVVAQFPIPITCLQGKNQLEIYMKTLLAKASSVKKYKIENLKIRDLKSGMKRIELRAKVLKLSEPKRVFTRYGTAAYVSNALVADETGSVRMSLWNQQIKMVSKGNIINIKNGKVIWFSGKRHLTLGRTGSLNIIE